MEDFRLSCDIRLYSHSGGGNLAISETVEIPGMSFDEMGDLLKGFHELTQAIKKAKGKVNE
jgi:predicted HTH domain antitoxin